MSGVEAEPPEDPLAAALAAYDDRLAAGIVKPHDELDQDVDPALVPDWNRLTAFLSLVEKAWPRAGPDSELLTISDPDGRKEPVPAQGPAVREDVGTTAPGAAAGEAASILSFKVYRCPHRHRKWGDLAGLARVRSSGQKQIVIPTAAERSERSGGTCCFFLI